MVCPVFPQVIRREVCPDPTRTGTEPAALVNIAERFSARSCEKSPESPCYVPNLLGMSPRPGVVCPEAMRGVSLGYPARGVSGSNEDRHRTSGPG